MYLKYYGIADTTSTKDAVLPETSHPLSTDLIPVQEPPLPSHTQSDTGIHAYLVKYIHMDTPLTLFGLC